MFSLRLLGGLALDDPSGPVSGPATQPARLALLAVLAVPEARSVSRDKLAALLWPETSSQRARRNLSDTLYVLRRELGEDLVRSPGDVLRLDPDRVRTDVTAFRDALTRGAPEEAVRAYGGPFLDGVHLRDSVAFERWVDTQRQQLARQYHEALASLARAAEDAGDPKTAVQWRRMLVAERPYRTSEAIALMRALEKAGDPAAAVRVGHLHEERLKEELEAEPDPALHAELERIRTSPDGSGAALTGTGGQTLPAGYAEKQDGVLASGGAVSSGLPTPPRALVRIGIALAAVILTGYGALYLSGHIATEGGDTVESLAVLPLEDLAPEREAATWFADGMTDALTTELGQIEQLTVISRISAMQYQGTDKSLPEVAGELGVDAVLEGSVLRAGDEVRITLRLIDIPTHRQLWAQSYEGTLQDVIGIQAQVAGAIAEEVEASVPSRLRRAEPRATRATGAAEEVNAEAYEAYLKGRYYFNRWGESAFRRAMHHFEEAIDLDPSFARAHAALANVCLQPSIFDVLRSLRDCRESALTALELDDESAEAHAVLGRIKTREWDWDGAESEFQRAIELNPNSAMAREWYSILLSTTLRREAAVEQIRRAEELDPVNLLRKTVVAVQLARAGRREEAEAQLDEVLELDPEFVLAHLVSATMGSVEEAPEHARFAVTRLGEDDMRPRLVTAVAHARAGEVGTALDILRPVVGEATNRPEAPIGFIAIAYKELGRTEDALRWLEKGVAVRSTHLPSITSAPVFDDLRAHPRFQKIRRRMGLR